MNVNRTTVRTSEEYFRGRREAKYQGAWAFLDGKIFNRSNIITNGLDIYSYGYHFPMAVKSNDGAILVNSDRYSMTTSHHQSALRTVLGVAGYAPVGPSDYRYPTRGYTFERWERS